MNKFLSASPIMEQQGLAIIRIITGLFMVYHGWEVFDSATMKGYAGWDQFKGLPSPALMVYLGKSAELVAGLLLAAGCLTRPAALVLILTMLYISFFAGHGKIWYDDQHPFLFVLLGCVFVFCGPGSWSIDRLLQKNKPNQP